MLKIYLCAFLKKEYLEEAKICIQSIRKHGLFTGKIYLFTDLDVYIDNVVIYIYLPVLELDYLKI